MSPKRLQGTPWHTERMHRAEGDERRHQSRCKHYIKKKNQKYCRFRIGNCIGSAHCPDYEVGPKKEEHERYWL